MIITIDGPMASGKTTIAGMLAKKLGFYYLSSGLLFRALAYILVHECGYDEKKLNDPRTEDIQQALAPNQFAYHYDASKGEQVFYNGKNITSYLKAQKISIYASVLGTNKLVRDALEILQHRIANHFDLVAEGRDAGTVIFPHADIKFYLTATLDVRAARFAADQKAKGIMVSLEQARAQVQERDQRDLNRACAPLSIAQGAIIIDDSDLDQPAVLALMEKEIKKIR